MIVHAAVLVEIHDQQRVAPVRALAKRVVDARQEVFAGLDQRNRVHAGIGAMPPAHDEAVEGKRVVGQVGEKIGDGHVGDVIPVRFVGIVLLA